MRRVYYKSPAMNIVFPYTSRFLPATVGSRAIFDSIDGGALFTGYSDFDYNGESNLDLEYAVALVYPQLRGRSLISMTYADNTKCHAVPNG